MKLIDRDELKKKKKHSKEFAENVVSVSEIDWQPTVDAIPVNWLTNLVKEYEESDNQFFRMDSCVIEDLIKRWKEQEKQNDSFD